VKSRSLTLALSVVVLVAGGASAEAARTSKVEPAFRLRVLRLVDRSRRAHFRNGTSQVRTLVTYVRVPTRGDAPYPLVVFGHGFTTTPRVYAGLLDTWAAAGYVVAAPVFPVENADAPGGPDESDLVNQPGDMSFVVSQLTAPTSPLRGVVDPERIAFAGQSDGAETALAATYDRRYLDRRVDAAVILSGAALPGFARPARSPPLLAVQGTRDPINSPSTTAAYFRLMHRPKFLLWLLGATHLPPYTTRDRWATVVDRATLAFLDHYLRGTPLPPLLARGGRHDDARIVSDE
jgi:dienelactone hydrolase